VAAEPRRGRPARGHPRDGRAQRRRPAADRRAAPDDRRITCITRPARHAHTFSEGLSARLVPCRPCADQVFAARRSRRRDQHLRRDLQERREHPARHRHRPAFAVLTAETGGEAAFNFLDVASTFTSPRRGRRVPNAGCGSRSAGPRASSRGSGSRPRLSPRRRAPRRLAIARPGIPSSPAASCSPSRGRSWLDPVQGQPGAPACRARVGQLDFAPSPPRPPWAARGQRGQRPAGAGRDWLLEAASSAASGQGRRGADLSHAEVDRWWTTSPSTAASTPPATSAPGGVKQVKANLTLPLDRCSAGACSPPSDLALVGGDGPGHGRLPAHLTGDPLSPARWRFSQDIPRLRSTWGPSQFRLSADQYRIGEVRRVSWKLLVPVLGLEAAARADHPRRGPDVTSRDYFRYRTSTPGRARWAWSGGGGAQIPQLPRLYPAGPQGALSAAPTSGHVPGKRRLWPGPHLRSLAPRSMRGD